MAAVDVIVRSTDQGSRNIQSFGQKLANLGIQALGLTSGLGAVQAGLGAVANAARMAWGAFEDGAALSAMEDKFENLSASIGTTADALNNQLGAATQGMMSNAQMVTAASDIISLGLGDTSDEVVRLGALVGKLGWDMQVLTLTMANDSMLRLDALGLSMENVKKRMEELKAAGMNAGDAFDLAVIEAGEAKVELLGNAAETTAGKIQQMTVVWENARDAFNQSFAEGLAERFDQVAGSVTAMGGAIEAAAVGAGSVLADIASSRIFTDPTFRWLIERGMKEMEAARAAEDAAAAIRNVDEGLVLWGQELDRQSVRYNAVQHFKNVKIDAAALDWELRQNAHMVEDARTQWDGLAVDMGVWGDNAEIARHRALQLGESLGFVAQSAEEMEAAKAAAEELALVYEEAAVRMGQAFSAALEPGAMPDFGNTGAMKEDAWEMAQSFGLSVEQLGNLGIALGEIDPDLAEMAAKAAIFQEAFGNLLGQFQAGNLDASGFVTAFDSLIADLNSNSLIEIQVDLKYKQTAAADFAAAADLAGIGFEEAALEVPIIFDPEEAALNAALGVIDGIPDEQTKIITFDPEYEAVTTAITTIEGDIGAIDGRVLMTPEAGEVYDVITALDNSRIEVYVDFVQGSSPEVPGRAAGGPVWGGEAYVIGERGPELFVPWTSGNIVPNNQIGGGGMQLSIQNYFYGPADAAEVAKASDTAARRMMERLQQVMSV